MKRLAHLLHEPAVRAGQQQASNQRAGRLDMCAQLVAVRDQVVQRSGDLSVVAAKLFLLDLGDQVEQLRKQPISLREHARLLVLPISPRELGVPLDLVEDPVDAVVGGHDHPDRDHRCRHGSDDRQDRRGDEAEQATPAQHTRDQDRAHDHRGHELDPVALHQHDAAEDTVEHQEHCGSCDSDGFEHSFLHTTI